MGGALVDRVFPTESGLVAPHKVDLAVVGVLHDLRQRGVGHLVPRVDRGRVIETRRQIPERNLGVTRGIGVGGGVRGHSQGSLSRASF